MTRFCCQFFQRLISGVMIGCVLACFTGCSFAPNSKRPEMPIPQKYKESMPWVMAKPSLAKESKHCRWWTVFHDPVLNNLESQLSHTNPSLNQAFERFQMSKALAQEARSFLLPTILGLGSGTRQGNSKEVANIYSGTDFLFDTFTLKTLLTYEIDVWGQIRNTASAAEHMARATEFDMAAIDLSLHASLAEIYFQLRGQNQQQIALDRIVTADEHALFLIHQLHLGGVVSAYEEDQMQKTVEHEFLHMQLSRLQPQGCMLRVPAIPPRRVSGHRERYSRLLPRVAPPE